MKHINKTTEGSYQAPVHLYLNHRPNAGKAFTGSVMGSSAFSLAVQKFNDSTLKQRILSISNSRDEDEVVSVIASSENDPCVVEQ